MAQGKIGKQAGANQKQKRPSWVSDDMFPFESRWFETPDGHQMHYVDEGKGDIIVFIHGNPMWSFEFRHLIAGLKGKYRCIAMDHIGFGLSSRSAKSADYHPQFHAKNFAALMDSLGVKDATFFVNDWGGPIGLDFARSQPERVKRLVISNSWCWPVGDDKHFKLFSSMMSSGLGQFLIRRCNFFVNMVLPKAVGNKKVMNKTVMTHYRKAQSSPFNRNANAALPGYIVGASDWLGDIWADRQAFINKPALLLWGLKDIAFREKELNFWQDHLTNATAHRFPDCGHFIAEEAPDQAITLLQEFMSAKG